MALALGLVVLGVVMLVGVFVYLRRIPDDQAQRLAATPGYDLELPSAERLWDTVGKSLGNAGTSRTQVWGVVGSTDDVVAFTDRTLGDLGYTKVAGVGVDGGEDGLLGSYRLDDARLTVTWVGLPHRIPGGRFLTTGYDFVVYTTIENGERAQRG